MRACRDRLIVWLFFMFCVCAPVGSLSPNVYMHIPFPPTHPPTYVRIVSTPRLSALRVVQLQVHALSGWVVDCRDDVRGTDITYMPASHKPRAMYPTHLADLVVAQRDVVLVHRVPLLDADLLGPRACVCKLCRYQSVSQSLVLLHRGERAKRGGGIIHHRRTHPSAPPRASSGHRWCRPRCT